MCFTVRQTYETCRAVVYVHDYCHEHIAHTRRQVDNKPCPKHVSFDMHSEDSICNCARYGGRDCITDVGYEKGAKYRFETEKDANKSRRNEELARAERARLAEEQKELERDAERKEAVARFKKRRRRLEEEMAWNSKFEEVNQGVHKIKMEGDTDMNDAEETTAIIKAEPHSDGEAGPSVRAYGRKESQRGRRAWSGEYNDSTASTTVDAGGGDRAWDGQLGGMSGSAPS